MAGAQKSAKEKEKHNNQWTKQLQVFTTHNINSTDAPHNNNRLPALDSIMGKENGLIKRWETNNLQSIYLIAYLISPFPLTV